MKNLFIASLMALFSLGLYADETFTFEEWENNCYKILVNPKNCFHHYGEQSGCVSIAALYKSISCSAGKKVALESKLNAPLINPFDLQTRPLDKRLTDAVTRCNNLEIIHKSHILLGENWYFSGRSAYIAMFTCMSSVGREDL